MKRGLHEKIISLLDLKKEKPYTILDFGCGTGGLLNDIAQHVDQTSRLIGVDAMKTAIETAQDTYPEFEYRHDRFVETFPFPDEYFDLVLSVDALECIPDKDRLLHEMWRILKPQGTIVCAHWDWDTQVYASQHPHLIRHLVHTFADWQQGWMEACDGMMGRKLWSLFQQTTRFQGKMDVFTLIETTYQEGNYGYDRLQDLRAFVKTDKIPLDDYECIRQEMNALHEQDKYFYSLNSYIYSGKRL